MYFLPRTLLFTALLLLPFAHLWAAPPKADDICESSRSQYLNAACYLTTDVLYREGANGIPFEVIPVWNAEEPVTVMEINCAAGDRKDKLRITVRLASGEVGYLELAPSAKLEAYLLPVMEAVSQLGAN